MKIVRAGIFAGLLMLLAGIFYLIKNTEDREIDATENYDTNQVKGYEDSLEHTQNETPINLSTLAIHAAQIEDFEARINLKGDSVNLNILKSNHKIYQYSWLNFEVKNIICSDLNGNRKPEFWIFGFNPLNHFKIFGIEFTGKDFKKINFPELMGRQKFGYQGGDSLYFSKSNIVHSFNFKNDLYSDIGTGTRLCYYALGSDNSFVLNKMLNLENFK